MQGYDNWKLMKPEDFDDDEYIWNEADLKLHMERDDFKEEEK